jgi:hypothetical protein
MRLEILSRGALPSDLSLAKVKNYCRVYDDEHDSLIELLIEAAVEFIQTYTRQTFRETQYREELTKQPIELARFPVLSIDEIEQTIEDAFEALSGPEVAAYELQDTTPPTYKGPMIGKPIRVTWTAGWDEWPKDLILLVYQMVEENLYRRGTTPGTAQAAQFSRAHQLALEQYCTHHDAVR